MLAIIDEQLVDRYVNRFAVSGKFEKLEQPSFLLYDKSAPH